MNAEPAIMAANPLRVLRAVASAFFGVRRKADADNDLEQLSLGKIVVAALVLMALFVTVILLIVRNVVA